MQHDKPRFPTQFGVNVLHKFRPYRTAQQKAWVKQILVEHKVYFSTGSELNDKTELRPRLRFRRRSTEAETREMLLADAELAWRRHKPPLTDDQLVRNRRRMTTTPVEELERQAIESTHQRLRNDYWVFSLAANPHPPHMWTKYADNGRGLCIHFHADRAPFCYAQIVIYQARRSTLWFPFEDLTEHDVGDIATRTKTRRWEIEDEYRCVRYPRIDQSDFGLTFDGQHAHFPSSAIAGITLGDQVPQEDANFLRAVAREHNPPFPVN